VFIGIGPESEMQITRGGRSMHKSVDADKMGNEVRRSREGRQSALLRVQKWGGGSGKPARDGSRLAWTNWRVGLPEHQTRDEKRKGLRRFGQGDE